MFGIYVGLKDDDEAQLREYEITIARLPHSSPSSLIRGDFGVYSSGKSMDDAVSRVMDIYPLDSYQIIDVRGI